MLLSNPAVIIISLIIILAIGYFNIGIASLMLVLFFILLFGSANSSMGLGNIGTGIEGFKTTTSDGDDIDIADETTTLQQTDNINKHIKKISKTLIKSKSNLKKKDENDKKLDERVNNIKDVVLGTINNIRNANNDDYKRALLENKQAMLYEEHENNNTRDSKSGKINQENFKDTQNQNKKINKTGKGSNERFQTIEIRALDPSNEDDTNLLITKEILQDMLNRIEYNYESNKYLRKYIKHRIEEIIDLNKLTEDE
jgi:Sec-independent protein translocase protein TatA